MNSRRASHRFLCFTSNLVTFSFLLSSTAPAFAADPVPLPRPRPAAADAVPLPHPRPAAADKKPAKDSSPKSAIALCDPDGGEAPTAGYGAPVNNFPPFSSPKFQNAFMAFVKDRANTTIDNQSANGTHKSYPGNQEGRPDLSTAIAARKRFFDISFGYSNDGIGAVVRICETKRQLAQHIQEYSAQKKKSSANSDQCADFKDTQQLFTVMQNSYNHYSQIIDYFLKGYSGQLNGKDVKIPSLENEFLENRRKNLDNINLYKPPATDEKPIKVSAQDWESLKAEFNILWGKGSVDRSSGSSQIDSVGFYSDMLLQTRKEKTKADDQANDIKKEKAEIDARAEKCGSLTTPASETAHGGKRHGDSTITGNVHAANPDLSGGSKPPGTDIPSDTDTPPANEKPPTAAAPPADNPAAPTPPADVPVTPPPPPQTNSAGSFLKDNWMWLAGGGALIGGGIVLYKYEKRKKAEQQYWNDPTNFMSPAAATGAS
ncbi:MAG: hypothetical protein ACXWP1_07265, partial [Bdellovibrionota bacterium]